MFKQYNYYFKCRGTISKRENEILHKLKNSKFSLRPLFEEYEHDLINKIQKFNLKTKKKVIEKPGWTIITNNKDIFFIFQYSNVGFGLTIFTENEKNALAICDILLQVKGVLNFQKGYSEDYILIRKLKKKIRKLGPNGKLIESKTLNYVFKKIISSDALRMLVKKIADTYHDLTVPLDQIKKLKADMSRLQDIVQDPKLMEKRFKVVCGGCKQPSEFLFETINDVKNSLKKAKYACPKCGNTKTDIVEYYALTPETFKAINQGLWLEKLCKETVFSNTNNYWCGYYLDTNEFDGITVFSGKVILIECKDTSYGQNELYITMMKADEIKANEILIVTTRRIHDNVKQLISKYEKKGKRKFHVIASNKNDKIKKELNKFFTLNTIKYITDAVRVEKDAELRKGPVLSLDKEDLEEL